MKAYKLVVVVKHAYVLTELCASIGEAKSKCRELARQQNSPLKRLLEIHDVPVDNEYKYGWVEEAEE